MLTVLSLLLASVATFRLADSVIEGNTMTTWMPANKVVYVAIQGAGTVEVQAKGADIGTKIKCQSPSEGMYCLLWTPDHNAFGLTKSASGESVQLVLEAVADQSSTVKFHVMSDDRLTFASRSNKVQLNGIREINASVSFLEFAGKSAFLKLTSEDPSTADYFNRLTLQLSGGKGKQATDASGRIAHLLVQNDGQVTVDLKLVAEAGQSIHFHAMADEHPVAQAHLADMRKSRWSVNSGKFASVKMAHDSMFLRRYNQAPIENTIPNRDTWHWLHDGVKTFKVMEDEVELKNIVGRGHFGTVHNAYDKHFKVDVVAKLIKKSRQFINEDVEFQVNNEVEVLNKLPVHPNVCRFYRAFETLNFVVLLLENCGSESMFRRYSRRSATESEVRYFLKQIVAGQQALQRAGVYQIDIKLTNMMVTSEGILKLIDFGLARLTDEEQFNVVGADGYYCPEMIFMIPYHPSMVDTWNDGICIYKMLYGNYCFGSQYDDFFKENLKELDYTFPPFPAISHDMKRLFSRLFQFEKKRYTLDELANDPWLTAHSN